MIKRNLLKKSYVTMKITCLFIKYKVYEGFLSGSFRAKRGLQVLAACHFSPTGARTDQRSIPEILRVSQAERLQLRRPKMAPSLNSLWFQLVIRSCRLRKRFLANLWHFTHPAQAPGDIRDFRGGPCQSVDSEVCFLLKARGLWNAAEYIPFLLDDPSLIGLHFWMCHNEKVHCNVPSLQQNVNASSLSRSDDISAISSKLLLVACCWVVYPHSHVARFLIYSCCFCFLWLWSLFAFVHQSYEQFQVFLPS